MADNETTADVIAWLRRPIEGENAYLTAWRDEIAARIEAAHRRERGDAAKLREALEALNRIDTRGLKRLLYELVESDIFDGGQINKTIFAVDKAKAALSAPPRNCDLPEVAKDPWRAWLDDKSNWDEDGNPELEIHDWLLAPATEKEGGAE